MLRHASRSCHYLVSVLVLVLALTSAEEEQPEQRGSDKRRPLHFKGHIHNSAYDYEALLGADHQIELADLPKDVRETRLRNIALSHDTNKNGIIEQEELQEWVLHSFKVVDHHDAEQRRSEEDDNGDGQVAFSEILKKQYAYSEPEIARYLEEGKFDDKEGSEDLLKLVEEDKLKFEAADVNKDGFLDETEYGAYILPYDHPHMHQVEVDRTMRDLDVDQDGFIDLKEFNRNHPGNEGVEGGEEGEEVDQSSDDTVFKGLDKNDDGKLDGDEVKPWALFDSTEAAREEAVHLAKEADGDADGQLTIDEIVVQEEHFISSQATNFGHNLHFVKDEL